MSEVVLSCSDLQKTYQYFTEAPMAKLRAAGFARTPTPLEAGVSQYVRDLQAHG